MNLLHLVPALGVLWWLGSSISTFARNYRSARASGLPIIVCAFNPDNMLYLILSVPLLPLLERIVPKALFDPIEVTIYGWEFRDRRSVHERRGTAFMLATTSVNRLYVADAAMALGILARRNDFPQHHMARDTMSIAGANVFSSDGDSWSRQRRIVAPSLNERTSDRVWHESVGQAADMAGFMLAQPLGQSRDVVNALKCIAINVLASVAYGQSKPWRVYERPTDPAAAISYTDAVGMTADLMILSAFISTKLLRLPFMPKLLQTLGVAVDELPRLTRDMLDQERRRAASASDAQDGPDTVMATLVRLSDEEKDGASRQKAGAGAGAGAGSGSRSGSGTKPFLTDDEISGNLFLFTAAGFDTTSYSLSYALTLLAAYPEWQVWVQAEIDEVFASLDHDTQREYSVVFPKLSRCLAVMLETTRLYPPAMHIIRDQPLTKPVVLAAHGTTYPIVGPCTVQITSITLHADAAHWGGDALEFRPARWLNADAATRGKAPLVTPAPGSFLGWSAGPRVCPGQKMSQVEFVGVVSTLLRKCSVAPVVGAGETPQQARDRLLEVLRDSQPELTLRMNRPTDIHLQWNRRRG